MKGVEHGPGLPAARAGTHAGTAGDISTRGHPHYRTEVDRPTPSPPDRRHLGAAPRRRRRGGRLGGEPSAIDGTRHDDRTVRRSRRRDPQRVVRELPEHGRFERFERFGLGQLGQLCACAGDDAGDLASRSPVVGFGRLPGFRVTDGLGASTTSSALVAEWATGVVLRVALARDGSTWTGTAAPFLTGLTQPVPVISAPDGSVLVGDWGTGTIYRIAAA